MIDLSAEPVERSRRSVVYTSGDPTLIESKQYAHVPNEATANIADDVQLMSLLENTAAIEAIEYGDPDSKKEGLQQLAVEAMRELGLPACFGKYTDLQADKALRNAVKSELTRREILKQPGYANQDLNLWTNSFDRIGKLIRCRLSAEEAKDLDNDLELWAAEMEHKSDRVTRCLAELYR